MLAKVVIAAFLAAFAFPALAECVSDHQSAATTSTPVASSDKAAPTSKPSGG